MTNLDSVLRSRDITLPAKVHVVKAMIYPVVRHRCESWTRMKAEYWKTDAFNLWCWRRFLRVPWTIRRSNQSILSEINPEYSLERTDAEAETLVLCLPVAKSELIRKDPDAGKDWRQEKGTGRQRMRELDGISDSMDWVWANFQEVVKDRESWYAVVHRVTTSGTWLSDWTTTSTLRQLL